MTKPEILKIIDLDKELQRLHDLIRYHVDNEIQEKAFILLQEIHKQLAKPRIFQDLNTALFREGSDT